MNEKKRGTMLNHNASVVFYSIMPKSTATNSFFFEMVYNRRKIMHREIKGNTHVHQHRSVNYGLQLGHVVFFVLIKSLHYHSMRVAIPVVQRAVANEYRLGFILGNDSLAEEV